MDIEKILINNNIINQLENDQKDLLINPIDDEKDIQKQEMTDILQNILKKILDSRLSNLENNSKKHFLVLNQTLSTTQYITDIASKMSKEIKEKKIQNKHNNYLSKITKKLNISQNQNNLISSKTPNRILSNRSYIKKTNKNATFPKKMKSESKIKTNLQGFGFQSKKMISEENFSKSPFSFRNLQNNVYKKNITNNSINYSPLNENQSDRKNVSTKLVKINNKSNLNQNNEENLLRKSIRSNDTNQTFVTKESAKSAFFLSSKKNNKASKSKKDIISPDKNSNKKSPRKKNVGIIGKMRKNIDKNVESPSKRKDIKKQNEKNVKESYINGMEYSRNNKNKIKDDNKIEFSSDNENSAHNFSLQKSLDMENLKANKEKKIIDLESNIKEETNLINNDPLLTSPYKDFELLEHGLIGGFSKDELNIILNRNSRKKFSIISQFSFGIENTFSDENLNNILSYLSIIDILKLKNCNKVFHRSVIEYLITLCDAKRSFFIEKQNQLNLPIEKIPKKLTIDDFTLSKGSVKALNLLNEEILNRIFIEEKPPNKEILIVYQIYFQLIKYQEITKCYNNFDPNIFWEKCKIYFRKNGGKTGNLLNDIISQRKIIIDGENIYKIYKLTEKNIEKINPTYFSKICGTTGLFVFFIKDILDFIGFSNDKNIQKNAYWSYSEIIYLLDSRINNLNKYIN